MSSSFATPPLVLDAVIGGAGASGIGMAIARRDFGLKSFVVLERQPEIGASFLR